MTRRLGRIERAILASIASSKRTAIDRTKKYRKVVEAGIATGRVQRFGVRLKDDESSVHITAWSLAYECFGPRPHKWGWTPSRSQIKACTRAIQSIARKFPQYAIIPGRGSKGIVLYEIADPVSVLRAKMRMGTKNRVGRLAVAAAFEGQIKDRTSRPDPVASPRRAMPSIRALTVAGNP